MPSAEGCWRVEELSTPEGKPGLQVIIDVPFPLTSLADAELEISAAALRLRGPDGDEVVAKVPVGSALDPAGATAKYSKKKRQLVICSPDVGSKAENSDTSTKRSQALPSPSSQESHTKATGGYPRDAVTPAPVAAPAPVASPAPTAQSIADDDDDDDDIPVLDSSAALGSQNKKSELDALDGEDTDGVPAEEVANEAAEEMMQKAMAAREKKQKASDDSRKEALKSTAGLKKGFFGNSKKKETKKKDSNDQQIVKAPPKEDIPYITGSGVDAKQAKLDALKLPEVQAALKQQTEKMKTDHSWCTPQLMQALAARPDLMKGLGNPRIMEAFTAMQKDPQAAKKKYENDKEVTDFLMEFSKLMATHFEVLGEEESKNPSQTTYTNPQTGQTVQGTPEMQKALKNPEVQKALKDPEVQQIIAEMQQGRPLEMHELGRKNPGLFLKLKVLLDAGLFNLQGT